jgi:hypothetical protein
MSDANSAFYHSISANSALGHITYNSSHTNEATLNTESLKVGSVTIKVGGDGKLWVQENGEWRRMVSEAPADKPA